MLLHYPAGCGLAGIFCFRRKCFATGSDESGWAEWEEHSLPLHAVELTGRPGLLVLKDAGETP